jgi:hypothetical protein
LGNGGNSNGEREQLPRVAGFDFAAGNEFSFPTVVSREHSVRPFSGPEFFCDDQGAPNLWHLSCAEGGMMIAAGAFEGCEAAWRLG